MLYGLSLGLIYIPIGVFIRQFFFKTINDTSKTTNILWYHMGHNVFGLIGYGIFSFLYMKVSILKNPKIKILIIVSFNSLDILGGSNGLN